MLEGKPKASNTIEIVKVAKSKRELIEIELHYGSPAVGLTISELSLPEGTIIALVARGEETLIPKGSITLQEDDQVFIVTKLLDKNAVEACFYPEK